MAIIPKKLKKDPIIDTTFEIRFVSRDLPEIVVGKIASGGPWKGWSGQSLGVVNIPVAVRQQDPQLQYQPTLELRAQHLPRIVKIGQRVFSSHANPPYPGWSIWKPELETALDFVFGSLEGFVATRLGFRYINAVSPEHLITEINQLALSVMVAGSPLDVPLNLNYQRTRDNKHQALVRIVSKEFVLNPAPADLTAIIDVDVSTPEGFSTADPNEARTWLNEAHVYLKEEFFRLIPDELLKKLAVEEAA